MRVVFALLSLLLLLEAKDTFREFYDFRKVKLSQQKSFNDPKDEQISKLLGSQWQSFAAKIDRLYIKAPMPAVASGVASSFEEVGPKIFVNFSSKEARATVVDAKDPLFDFFGSGVSLYVPKELYTLRLSTNDKEDIYTFFSSLSEVDLSSMSAQIVATMQSFELNDWGLFMFVDRASRAIYTDDRAVILAWRLLSGMGYDVRLAIGASRVLLLARSGAKIYDRAYYEIAGEHYYLLSEDGIAPTITTYATKADLDAKDLDLTLLALPKLAIDERSSTLSFSFETRGYTLEVKHNQNLAEFFRSYPNAGFDVLAKIPLDPLIYNSIMPFLQSELDAKRSSWVLNFLLAFTQGSFEYKTAPKIKSISELVADKAGDAKDRLLFASVFIKELLGIRTAGVLYENYITLALDIPLESRYKVLINNREFAQADLVSKNLNAGEISTTYRELKPRDYIIFDSN